MPYQVFQFEAVKWGTDGIPHPMRPLQSDTVSFALGINETGQAVGCVRSVFQHDFPTQHRAERTTCCDLGRGWNADDD